jgi:hypothetical protein
MAACFFGAGKLVTEVVVPALLFFAVPWFAFAFSFSAAMRFASSSLSFRLASAISRLMMALIWFLSC